MIYLLLTNKKDEILSISTMWMKLGVIMLSEISQARKDKHHVTILTCGVYKKVILKEIKSKMAVVRGRERNGEGKDGDSLVNWHEALASLE